MRNGTLRSTIGVWHGSYYFYTDFKLTQERINCFLGVAKRKNNNKGLKKQFLLSESLYNNPAHLDGYITKAIMLFLMMPKRWHLLKENCTETFCPCSPPWEGPFIKTSTQAPITQARQKCMAYCCSLCIYSLIPCNHDVRQLKFLSVRWTRAGWVRFIFYSFTSDMNPAVL